MNVLTKLVFQNRDNQRMSRADFDSYLTQHATALTDALEKIIELNSGSIPLPWDTQNIARAALAAVKEKP